MQPLYAALRSPVRTLERNNVVDHIIFRQKQESGRRPYSHQWRFFQYSVLACDQHFHTVLAVGHVTENLFGSARVPDCHWRFR